MNNEKYQIVRNQKNYNMQAIEVAHNTDMQQVIKNNVKKIEKP